MVIMNQVTKKSLAAPLQNPLFFVFISVALLITHFFVRRFSWQGSLTMHTVSETIGTILSLFVGIISLVRYYSKKDNTFLFISLGFLGTSIFTGFHTMVTSAYFLESIPFSGSLRGMSNLLSRLFLALFLFLSLFLINNDRKHSFNRVLKKQKVFIALIFFTTLSFFLRSFYTLPLEQYTLSSIEIIDPPIDFIFIAPITLNILTIIGYYHKGDWGTDRFEYWLMLSLILSLTSELIFFFSSKRIDVSFAHIVRNFSSFFVFIGLLLNIYRLFQQSEEHTEEVKNINEALKAEIQEKKAVEKELKESEERYRLLVEYSPDMIAVNTDGHWSYINTTGRKLLGASCKKTDIIGKPVFQFIHPEDHEKVLRRVEQIHLEKKGINLLERRFKTLDGRILDMEVQTLSIMYKGKPSIQIVARDVTERRKTEELLRHSEKLSAVGQLAAGIAHEIRNPLTSLKGFIQLIQTGSNEKREYFDIMFSELKRIESIISELLFLAKPQGSQFDSKDILDILKHVTTLIDTQAILANIQIKSEIECDFSLIRCEENQIKQVFVNVLKNAIEAMPNGGIITVRVKTMEKEKTVRVSVIDQGVGIPESMLSKVGEPFFTTKDKGTGLGFMVSHRIIRNHGGRIQVESIEGIGTTIHIDLPLAAKEEFIMV